MTTGDAIIEKGAGRLQELSTSAEAAGGVRAKLAPELRGDAAFLRKLKPSLIVERVRGERAIDPSPADRPNAPKQRGAGPSPFLVATAAFAVGVLLAKAIDWRGHAHPRAG